MAKQSFWTLLTLCALLFVSMAAFSTSVNAASPSARASHILVKTEVEADDLANQLAKSDDVASKFADLAKEFSKCPSGRKGGDLGTFGRGAMVGPFDKVVFEKSMGVVHKVETQFGWHLVLTTERSGVDEAEIARSSEL